MGAIEILAVAQAWQNNALSRNSMLDVFRRGEVLPESRTNQKEVRLIAIWKPEIPAQGKETRPKRQMGLGSAEIEKTLA